MRSTVCVLSSLLAAVVWGADVLAGGVASASTVYTNIAGQVISGPVQRVADGKVTFGGRDYPLRIFSVSEQRRILKAAKVSLPPKRSLSRERTDLFYKTLLSRQDALERQGAVSHEKAERQREIIRKAWRQALERRER